MKLLAPALCFVLSACAQFGPVVDSRTHEIVCCAIYIEPTHTTLLSVSVEETDRKPVVNAKASIKF